MPFITQGKTNWKFLLIVIILAFIVGGGALWYEKKSEQNYQTVEDLAKNIQYSEHLSIEKEEAEDVLKNYAQQYLEKTGLDLNIIKMNAEFGQQTGVSIRENPKKPGTNIGAYTYSGDVLFSKDSVNGKLSFYYDATVTYGLNFNVNDKNIFVKPKSCIVNDSECGVIFSSFVECDNYSIPEPTDSELSKYFVCHCKQTGMTNEFESRPFASSSWEECQLKGCSDEKEECRVTGYSTSAETNTGLCYKEVRIPSVAERNCSLDFSMSTKSSSDNKAIITIETPKSIPGLSIKGKNCSLKKDIQAGTNEIATDCDFGECIRLFLGEYKIAETNCHYKQ